MLIPHIYEDNYTDSIKDYLLVYNPISEKGIAVLNKEAAYVYSLIDNKRTINDILLITKSVDSKCSYDNVLNILTNFISSEIVFFDKPKSKILLFNKQPKHLGVWFHITNQCNLRCTYCYINKTPEKMSDKTALYAIKKIILDAKKKGFDKISIKFSGGECLLEFTTIIKVVKLGKKIAKQNNIFIEFIILSNGVLITNKIAKILNKYNIKASISLDGLEKFHDKQRIFSNGLGSFKYVEKGIQNLQSEKVPFNVSVTITSNNIQNIPELTKYLLKNKILFVFNFYRENSYVNEKLEESNKTLISYMKKAYQIISDNLPQYTIINDLLDRVSFRGPHKNTCGVGINYLIIRHDGMLFNCQNLLSLGKPFGSIYEKNIIQSMYLSNIKQSLNVKVDHKVPCNKCQWKYVCCGGCPLLTYQNKGTYKSSSPYCGVYKTLIPELLRIEAKRIIKYGYQNN